MAEINASESFEFVLAFHPGEATSYAQKAILRCGDLTYETKASEDVLLSAAKSTDSLLNRFAALESMPLSSWTPNASILAK